MPTTARVILPLPLTQAFSYIVPDELSDAITAGSRVVVPFGPRSLTGIVVDLDGQETGTMRPILDLLDDRPALTPELLKLTEWIAEYYACGWGEVARAALPPGTLEQTLTRAKVRIKKEVRVSLSDRARSRLPADLLAEVRGPKQQAILSYLATPGTGRVRRADLLAATGATTATVQGLVRRGLLDAVEEEVFRSQYDAGADQPPAPSHVLHSAQQEALSSIGSAISDTTYKTFLLHGVTGSGKTEVYIEALKQVRAGGKTGIMLVPEIALTPQTVARFQAHFGREVAVMHSRMSAGERYDSWRHLRSGRFPIVIGPRSAILAPLRDIGIIIVDEEHESSYKQFDPAPRYQARDVAVMRAMMNDAVCLLGSATPSIESFANAKAGKYTLLSMPVRVPVAGREAAPLPDIRIVDLTLEKKKRRLEGAFSMPLREAIADRLERKEQVILLQNRRGYAPVIECSSCGWSPTCKDCAVTLTYHKAKGHLRCHYCGSARRFPDACPECQDRELVQLGTGTQRVQEELVALFPSAGILRMDLDTTSRKNAHHTILERFGRGKADILLGTQMVAKGLDFARVTLVGVVNADTGMLLPDFRAGERTFQLLTQVAGRAGRGDLKGEVIIQTRNAGHPALRFACAYDYLAFFASEMEDRKQFGYPPFGRIVGVEIRGPEEKRTEAIAKEWTDRLRSTAGELVVLGPEPAFVGRVKRTFRFNTIIKVPRGHDPARLRALLGSTSASIGRIPKGCRISIDVDPVGIS